MKIKIFITIGLFGILFLSCEKDKDSAVPILSINKSSLSFSRDNDVAFIIITNSGDGELSWNIISKPDWINVSKESGQITSEELAQVRIQANANLDVGNYSGEISINSNGGNSIVNVTLSIEPKIEIFPGVGAAKIALGNAYSIVKLVYGEPDRSYFIERAYWEGGVLIYADYEHYVLYDSIKVVFEFFNKSKNVNNTDKVLSIEISAPYDGVTDKLIGIGSSLNDIIVAYGEPPEIITSYTNYYKYESLGISFYYNEGGTSVTKIEVY